jgi:hypothetical protein
MFARLARMGERLLTCAALIRAATVRERFGVRADGGNAYLRGRHSDSQLARRGGTRL